MEGGNGLAGLFAYTFGVLAKGRVGRLQAARHQSAHLGLHMDVTGAAIAQRAQGLQGVLLAAQHFAVLQAGVEGRVVQLRLQQLELGLVQPTVEALGALHQLLHAALGAFSGCAVQPFFAPFAVAFVQCAGQVVQLGGAERGAQGDGGRGSPVQRGLHPFFEKVAELADLGGCHILWGRGVQVFQGLGQLGQFVLAVPGLQGLKVFAQA